MTKTTYVNRLENGLSAVRRRWTASEKVRIGRGDLRAGNDCELGGSPARRCAKPVVHVTPIGGARQPDCGRQWRGGCAGVGLSGVAQSSSLASSAAGQEDPGGRDSQGGSGTRHRLKKTAAAAAVAAEGRYATKTVQK